MTKVKQTEKKGSAPKEDRVLLFDEKAPNVKVDYFYRNVSGTEIKLLNKSVKQINDVLHDLNIKKKTF